MSDRETAAPALDKLCVIARHGKDFAMGVLVLSARFIAEGKPLIKREVGAGAKLS
jgi:hypothetical protein